MRKKKKYKVTRRNEMVAIVIDVVNGRKVGRSYHTQDLPNVLPRFIRFIKSKYPSALYINYYDLRRRYRFREYLYEQNVLSCNSKPAKHPARFSSYRSDNLLRFMQLYTLN